MKRVTIENTGIRRFLSDLSKPIQEQADVLDRVAQILQEAQLSLPLPTREEIADLRRGGPLSMEAYLLGVLQRVILSAENAASDLRAGIDPDTLKNINEIRLSVVEINAIETALQERQSKAGGRDAT
jgi:hypothetical protein